MAIKKLQNNFTTPEQSKRLLELGVPADSANCCLRRILTDGGYCETWRVDVFDFIGQIHDDYLPCWSIGRLIEIYVIARGVDTSYLPIERGEDMVKYLIRLYEEKVKDLDFSKLED